MCNCKMFSVYLFFIYFYILYLFLFYLFIFYLFFIQCILFGKAHFPWADVWSKWNWFMCGLVCSQCDPLTVKLSISSSIGTALTAVWGKDTIFGHVQLRLHYIQLFPFPSPGILFFYRLGLTVVLTTICPPFPLPKGRPPLTLCGKREKNSEKARRLH